MNHKNHKPSIKQGELHKNLTPYLRQQIKKSPAIAQQYLPDPFKKTEGEDGDLRLPLKPFQGIIKTGIPGLERMYLDRVAILFTSQCFAYCRFCFRKNYNSQKEFCDPKQNFQKIIKYIETDTRIKEVLITGGDPLLFPKELLKIIRRLHKLPQLTSLRIGTRVFTVNPKIVTKKFLKPIIDYNKINLSPKSLKILNVPKSPITIATQFNHPDELTPECNKALLLCTQNNIPVYNQTVLLKDINDNAEILISLCRQLRQLGVEPYRIYHCDPVQGAEHFRTSLEQFLEIKKEMRQKASGRIVPSFVVDTKIGKIELGDSEIALNYHKSHKKPKVFIKTPYTLQSFQTIDPHWKPPSDCSLSSDGFIICKYVSE